MPDLRDLLNDAVDRPAPLDLDGLGHRVARHQRHRRVATITAAAIVMVLVGAAAASLAGRADSPDVDIDRVPLATEGSTTVPSSTTPGTTPGTTAGAAGGSACTADDVDIVPSGDGATAQMAIILGVALRPGREPCTIATTATVALRYTDTGDLIPLEGNPLTTDVSGVVDGAESDVVRSFMTWSGCPADFHGNAATIEVVVEGFGTFRGETAPPGMCGDTTSGIFTKGDR
jgi:hypothetical protein